ncbi:MAG: SDR family oxidoreductase [Ignavibacteria bacterium]|nr:SDR family oxidoreductase [Ignavibacteria bacterium]
MDLNRKTALVTGGGRRLGKHIALELAASGFDIAFTYNSTPQTLLDETIRQITGRGVSVLPVRCDVRKTDSVFEAAETVFGKFGTVDVLVNNAAIFRKVDFFDITEEIFDEFVQVNLKSILFFSQACALKMLENKRKPAKIINISSLGAFENWPGYIPYSVSKAGVVKLTQLLAKKLAPGILVNSIAPGTIIIEDDENANVDPDDERKYPLKRFGNSKDVTSLVRYLAEENTFITGQTICVDGGKLLN